MKSNYRLSWLAVAAFCAFAAYTYAEDLLTGILIFAGMLTTAVLLGRWAIGRNGS